MDRRKKGRTDRAKLIVALSHSAKAPITNIIQVCRQELAKRDYTRSPFVTCMSRRAQSGRRTSFGIRMGFIGTTHSLHHDYIFICILDATSEPGHLIK